MLGLRWGLRVATDERFGAGHIARAAALAAALPGEVAVFVDPGAAPPAALGRYACTKEASVDSAHMLAEAARDRLDAAIVDSPVVADAELARVAARVWTAAFRDGVTPGSEQLAIDLSPGAVDSERVLCGPGWAPLAPHFADAHDEARRIRSDVPRTPRLLVAFGARDSVNRTGLVAASLALLPRPPATTIVRGRSFEHAAALERTVAGRPDVVQITDPGDMIALYLSHDLAAGAPGVSQYERACCGLPALLVPQNDNQGPLAVAWAAQGSARAAAPAVDALAEQLAALIEDATARESMCAAALAAVDGRGAQRLADALARRARGRIEA